MSNRAPGGFARGWTKGIVIVALLVSLCAAATDFSGKWSGSSPDGKSVGPVYAVLRQDGATLTGSAGPNESRQFPITTGKVVGDHLSFEVKMGGGIIRFDLSAAESDLKGTMKVFEGDGRSDTTNIVLKRIPK